jgi:hypothetical protein
MSVKLGSKYYYKTMNMFVNLLIKNHSNLGYIWSNLLSYNWGTIALILWAYLMLETVKVSVMIL